MFPNELIIHIISFVNCSKTLFKLSHASRKFQSIARTFTPKQTFAQLSFQNDLEQLILYPNFLDFRDQNGQTTLHIASFNDHRNQVKFILDTHPALINTLDKFNNSSLFISVIRNNHHVCEMILNKGAKIQIECLDFAIQNMNIELIKRFLNMGIITDNSLFIAIEIENLEIIKILIPYYQNFTSRIRNGWSLLHCAVYTGNIQICKLLLDNGCFINAIDNYGTSPLHVAIHGNGDLSMVKFLCKSGACMDLKSLSGISPLIRAVMCRNYAVCNYLIAEGCDVSITTVGGATAASIANMKGYYQIQQLLKKLIK